MSGSSTTLTNSNNDLRRDIWATGMDGQRSMGSNWKCRYEGRGHFCMFLISCLSSLLQFFGSRPSTSGIGMYFNHVPMEVEFPRESDLPKGHHCAVWISCGIYEFIRFRTMDDCLILCFPFLLFSYNGIGSPGGLNLRRGIM
jgi:hypothetical protein